MSFISSPPANPGGSTTQLQYNLAGIFAGTTNITYDASGSLLFAAGSTSHVALGINANSGTIYSGNNTVTVVGGAAQSITQSTGFLVDRTIYFGWSDAGGIVASGTTAGTVFTRQADGAISLSTGSSGSGGKLTLAGLISGGTKFTLSASVGSADTTVGGATAGSFVSRTTGAITIVLTFNGATGLTAPNGWFVRANNLTTTANPVTQSATSTTTATVTATTVSGDVINFSAIGY